MENESLTNPARKGGELSSGYICLDICLSSLRVLFSRSTNLKCLRHPIEQVASAMCFDRFGDFQEKVDNASLKNTRVEAALNNYQSLPVYTH